MLRAEEQHSLCFGVVLSLVPAEGAALGAGQFSTGTAPARDGENMLGEKYHSTELTARLSAPGHSAQRLLACSNSPLCLTHLAQRCPAAAVLEINSEKKLAALNAPRGLEKS